MSLRNLISIVIGFSLLPGVLAAQQVEYYHLDALGSVRGVTDESGAIVVRHDYYPYGEEWNEPASQDTRRFTGKERDDESGLDYFGARYYGPETARFASVDPVITWGENLTDPQRWNRYAYARDNPLRYTDPDGRVVVPVLLGAWAVFEVASTAYDAYTAYQTVTDPNAGKAAKAIAVGGLILGVASVGGGYGTAGKEALEHADTAVGLLRGGDKAGDAARVGGQGADSVRTFDQARREAFERAGMTDSSTVQFTKVDPKTGTVVEFKGAGGAKVAYDGPHPNTPGAGHSTQHVGWQSGGKRTQGGAERGNIPYGGPQHPSRSPIKGEGTVEPH